MKSIAGWRGLRAVFTLADSRLVSLGGVVDGLARHSSAGRLRMLGKTGRGYETGAMMITCCTLRHDRSRHHE